MSEIKIDYSMDEAKAELLKISHPSQWNDFTKKYPKVKFDEESSKQCSEHMNNIFRKFGSGETPENHSDPRAAFTNK